MDGSTQDKSDPATPGDAPRRRGRKRRAAGRAAHWLSRVFLSVLLIAVGAAAILFARLQSGPISLPSLAQQVETFVEANTDDIRIEIGDLVLSLGDEGEPAGLQLRDVTVMTPEGEVLASAPRFAARFRILDLIRGDLMPTRISLNHPSAEILRTADGHVQIGMISAGEGPDAPVPTDAPRDPAENTAAAEITASDPTPVSGEPGEDPITPFLDALVGDAPGIPLLSRLEEIVISDISFSYVDEVTGGAWATTGADLTIRKTGEGIRAELEASVGTGAASLPVRATAERRRGEGRTEMRAIFEGVDVDAIQAQIPNAQFSDLVEATVMLDLATHLERDGTLGQVTGEVTATDGVVHLSETEERRFDRIAARLRYDPEAHRGWLETLEIEGPEIAARLGGIIAFPPEADGAIPKAQAQFDVHALRLSAPELLAEDLSFDGGQVAVELTFAPFSLKIADSWLKSGPLDFSVNTHVRSRDDGVVSDIRLGTGGMEVAQLLDRWPLEAAPGARRWVAENIRTGLIEEVVFQVRLIGDEPEVFADFTFSGVHSQYIAGMSPVLEGRGRGHLTADEFHLILDRGEVRPIGDEPLQIVNSRMVMRGLSADVPPAEVELTGTGPVRAVLTLIDQEPLGLVRKLGLDPAGIAGRTRVTAKLGFPLLKDLLVEQVAADVRASLHDVEMPFPIAGETFQIASEFARLEADTREMRIQGKIQVDGIPLTLDWQEDFASGENFRQIAARGTVTPQLLSRFGVEQPVFHGGSGQAAVTITQTGSPDLDIGVRGNFDAAALRLPGFDWEKAPGARAALVAELALGEKIALRRLNLRAEDLVVVGSAELTDTGALDRAVIERFTLGERINLTGEISAGDIGNTISVRGSRFDMGALEEGGDNEGGGTPIAVEFSFGNLVLDDGIEIGRARGTYSRSAAGARAELTGTFGPDARIRADYEKLGKAPAMLDLRSPNAAAVLNELGIYSQAVGGAMSLKAVLDPVPGETLQGTLEITDLQLEDDEKFAAVLRAAEFRDRDLALASDGLIFRSIRVPFTLAGDKVRLDKSFAKSPSLAVTASGEIDRGAGQLDLVGAISPAYVVTGALDSVPVLGEIISGGEGEGIFAMTFSLTGSVEDPQFSYNPLSLLTPGFLRNIFSGKGGAPDEEFFEPQLGNDR